MYKQTISLNLHNIDKCRKCGQTKAIVRVPGRTTVYCPKCDKL